MSHNIQSYYMKNKQIKQNVVNLKTSPVFGLAVLLFLSVPFTGYASKGITAETKSVEVKQEGIVNGVVKDATGSPLIGVSVVVKGTTNGVLTDLDGNFSFKLSNPNVVLVFSYVGFKTQEVAVAGQNNLSVTLKEDLSLLDEVVVVGYGVQKKKLITGATVQVNGDNIQKMSTTSAFTALQSQTPGVNITQSSGQPGEGFKVYIRGIGTIGDYAPLYVIDGVAGGDINNLSPADIESIDVLKDAASAAIYGARAANGVILVTTKQGKSGKIQVSYDGYLGWQNVYKMPSLLNAQQYMQVMDEVNFNEGLAPNDWKKALGSYYDDAMSGAWTGTNWLEEIRNKNAVTQSHALNIVGGSELSKFSLGISYTAQDGILGKPVASEYERTTVRMNSDHVLWKSKDLEIIKVGENMSYNYTVKNGIGIGNQYGNDISSALRGMPIMPVYDAEGNYFDRLDKEAMGLSNYEPLMANPKATMVYERGYNTSKSYNLNMSAYVQVQPIKNLVFKSQFGYKMSSNNYRSYKPKYDLATSSARTVALTDQHGGMGWNFTWDNTLNYKFTLADSHHFDALIGQSIEKSGMGEDFGATNGGMLFDGYKYAYLDNSSGLQPGVTTWMGAPWTPNRLVSFFGRVNYDWNETYMLSLIMRGDASSNFARGNRWGYFPSVSAGWLVTNEKFMDSSRSWLDFLKLRGSWGQNGNNKIDPFQYLAMISFDDTAAYSFGNNKEGQSTGGYASILPNPAISWETSEQLDLGLDARFLNSRLGVAFDWYTKKTKDWLVKAPILGSYGMGNKGAPYINGGTIENKGIELGLNWNDRVQDFGYSANLNLAYNKNEVTEIKNAEGIIHGKAHVLSQGTTEMYRAQVNHPLGYFYGYKTAGIFQNQAEIAAWKADGNGILQGNVQPGDVKFVDLNHDGVINDEDKTQIGNPNPKYTLGFSMNFDYKGFDLSFTTYGAFGQQIAKSYRRFGDGRHENYTTDVYERWHGENTSNKMPRLTAGNNANLMNISDIYIENGDYLRMQNITLGYDFKRVFKTLPFSQARFYFSAQNLFTITGYSGMDPEVGYSAADNDGTDNWASGIDLGFYPSPRTYLFGVNLKF